MPSNCPHINCDVKEKRERGGADVSTPSDEKASKKKKKRMKNVGMGGTMN